MAQVRQKEESVNSWIISLAKAAISLVFLGVLSFIGTWAVGVNTTIASMQNNVLVLQEKERMVTEMMYPQLMDQIKELKLEIKEIHNEIRKGK